MNETKLGLNDVLALDRRYLRIPSVPGPDQEQH